MVSFCFILFLFDLKVALFQENNSSHNSIELEIRIDCRICHSDNKLRRWGTHITLEHEDVQLFHFKINSMHYS